MKNKSEIDRELGKYLRIKKSLEFNLSLELYSYSLRRVLKENEMTKGKLYRVKKLEKDIEKLTLKINSIKRELQKYKNIKES